MFGHYGYSCKYGQLIYFGRNCLVQLIYGKAHMGEKEDNQDWDNSVGLQKSLGRWDVRMENYA